jgi:hypothetical protein
MGSIGDAYPYWNYIKTPDELSITSNGNFPAFMKDIEGLFDYGELLLLSHSNASTIGNTMGNKQFLNTGGQCCPTTMQNPWEKTPCSKDDLVDRYIFINNIPTGNLPFITSQNSSGSSQTGLLPGILEDVFKIPMEIEGLFGALTAPANPPCVEVELQVIDTNNNSSVETQYVASSDIIAMNPSDFLNGKIPISESFMNLNNQITTPNNFINDPIISLYFILLIILAIYIFYKLFYLRK